MTGAGASRSRQPRRPWHSSPPSAPPWTEATPRPCSCSAGRHEGAARAAQEWQTAPAAGATTPADPPRAGAVAASPQMRPGKPGSPGTGTRQACYCCGRGRRPRHDRRSQLRRPGSRTASSRSLAAPGIGTAGRGEAGACPAAQRGIEDGPAEAGLRIPRSCRPRFREIVAQHSEPKSQSIALAAAGILPERMVTEQILGAVAVRSRPALSGLLAVLRPGAPLVVRTRRGSARFEGLAQQELDDCHNAANQLDNGQGRHQELIPLRLRRFEP